MMQRSRWVPFALMAVLAVVSLRASFQLPQDRGPATLDVSSYPMRIQAGYKLLVQNCGRCHTLARVLNTTAPPRFWARYLGNLQAKGETAMSNDDAVLIYDFLVQDEISRKEKNPKGFYPPLTEDELKSAEGKK